MDSSKFIEHLRKSHYSIVLTSLTMIVLLSFNQRDKIEIALEQLSEIKNITEEWNPYWLKKYIADVYYEDLLAYRAPINKGLIAKDIQTGITYDLRFNESFIINSDDDYIKATLGKAKANEEYFRGFTPLKKNKIRFITNAFVPPPSTVIDFRSLWNGLEKPLEVDYLNEIDSLVTISYFSNEGDSLFKEVHYAFNDFESNIDRQLFFEVESKDTEKNTYVLLASHKTEDTDEQIRINVAFTKTTFDSRYGLESTKLGLRKFEEIFPELNSLSSDLDNLPFQTLDKLLRKERDRQKDAISVLGVNIPNDVIKLWGALIILVLQLYFYLHSRNFLSVIKKGIFETPWIGLYDNWISIITTHISVSILPLLTVCYLSSGLYGGKFNFSMLFLIYIIFSMLLSFFTTRILIKIQNKKVYNNM